MKADDLLLHVLGREPRLQPPLRVDQLDGTYDLVVVVAHRDREHRLRPVPELGVEALAADRLAGWRVVRVVVPLALSLRDRIADDRLLVHRHRERRVGALVDRVVLAGGEEELRAAFIVGFQPQARAVRVGELAHRREDESLQPVDVLLRRQGDADLVQLAELPVAAGDLRVELLDLALELDILLRHPKQLTQGGWRGIDRWSERDVRVTRRRLLAWTDQDERGLRDLNRDAERCGRQAELGQQRGELGLEATPLSIPVEVTEPALIL